MTSHPLLARRARLCAGLAARRGADLSVEAGKMIVPFGAGGPADVYARVLAKHL